MGHICPFSVQNHFGVGGEGGGGGLFGAIRVNISCNSKKAVHTVKWSEIWAN